MWERDAEGNRILQMVKQESDHDLLSQAAASIKQVNIEAFLKSSLKRFLDRFVIIIKSHN